MKRIKTLRSVYVYDDIFSHSQNNPEIKSLAEWINEDYPKKFMDLEREEKELENLQLLIKDKKARIKHLRNNAKTQHLIEPRLWEWIKTEGCSRVFKRGISIEGVLKFFNNTYNQELNLKQFRILLKKANEEQIGSD